MVLVANLIGGGCEGTDQDPGAMSEVARSDRSRMRAEQIVAFPERGDKHVLFGDLHVHTTYSLDAFFSGMPILGGEGAHPPADACDFARHCAALDFFSITDHAQELTPAHWQAEKDAVRQCNAVGGDPSNPDLVAFHGFEWTQIGAVPEKHYGHKNVIFRGLADDEVPARPISARGPENVSPWLKLSPIMRRAGLLDPLNWEDYASFGFLFDQIEATPFCPDGVPTRDLPLDCSEVAVTPRDLFRKLDEWDLPALVIPHGSAWGSYTPATSSWDKHLAEGMHDPRWQRLIEVMSGHGNSEQYREFREFERTPGGDRVCPAPTEDYLPCCWQAGEIMRSRCGDLPADECETRVERAKQLAMRAGNAPDNVFPGTDASDWLDCGQDRRGFKPAYSLRPRSTVQYALSLEGPETPDGGNRFRPGFIASSDNHSGRAGTGYRLAGRKKGVTDMIGARNEFYDWLLDRRVAPDDPQMPVEPSADVASALNVERLASFLYPGGLVAVHADGRDRDSIWDALHRRETYGTSGPRILLWFDYLAGDGRRLPMGSEVRTDTEPQFRVRTLGGFVQKPGCPDETFNALSDERVRSLCLDECYHPGDQRHPIVSVEVVRIRPARTPDEPIEGRIEDPWKTFRCPPDPAGCSLRFSDPDFVRDGRDTLYYVRALQEPTEALNGDNLRVSRDATGAVDGVRPCFVGAREEEGDDCLATVRERAWSSPIYVDFGDPS